MKNPLTLRKAAPAGRTASADTRWWRPTLVRSLAVLLCLVAPVARCAEAATAPPASASDDVDLTEVSLQTLMDFKVQSVYGASKHEQKLSEAPSSVTIVDSEEIKKYGARNFADVLNSVRGLYVTYDRNYSYLGIRGFNRPGDYSSRVLVLVDGHRLNENIFDSVLIGNDFPLDVDVIDRIEVIRGPGSSIYGNNAFFGVINVITKTGSAYQGAEVSGSVGSFDSYTGRFSYGNRFKNGLQLMASATFYNSEGPDQLYYPEFNTPSNNVNNGITRHTDYERFYKVLATLSYNDFALQGLFSSREKGIPTGAYGTIFNDPRAKTTDNRGYLDLKYHHRFANDLEVTARLSYDNYWYYGDYPVVYPTNPDVLYQDYALGNWWGSEVQVNKKMFQRHTLTLGAEFRDNFQQDQGNKDNAVPRTVYNAYRSSSSFAFYGQGEALILTNLILNAGVRYDNFDAFGQTVNPRLALIYSPWQPTTFKLLYGTAFKGPNVYELYYSGPNNKANPGLKPETIKTYEAVYEQQLTRDLSFTAAGFYYQIDDLINSQVDPADGLQVYRNLGQVDARGGEAELDAKFPGGLRGRASYTYQVTKDLATGLELSNSPRHLAKFNLIVPLYQDQLFSGLEAQYTSRAGTLAGSHANAFWLANVTILRANVIKNLEASVSIYNLFDQRYYYPGRPEHLQDLIQQDGRTFRVKLTYRF